MINDLTQPAIERTVRPSAKPALAKSVSAGDVMRAAHQFRRDHGVDMSTALQWANECKIAWAHAVTEREEEKRLAYFAATKRRKHCGRLVDAIEVIGYRPGIERVSLNRAEKIRENERALAKGLEPKYLTL